MKVFVLWHSSQITDDGFAGIFSTREKARTFFEAHPKEFFGTQENTADDFIEECEVDIE